jgi:hypothetical protein
MNNIPIKYFLLVLFCSFGSLALGQAKPFKKNLKGGYPEIPVIPLLDSLQASLLTAIEKLPKAGKVYCKRHKIAMRAQYTCNAIFREELNIYLDNLKLWDSLYIVQRFDSGRYLSSGSFIFNKSTYCGYKFISTYYYPPFCTKDYETRYSNYKVETFNIPELENCVPKSLNIELEFNFIKKLKRAVAKNILVVDKNLYQYPNAIILTQVKKGADGTYKIHTNLFIAVIIDILDGRKPFD